MNDFSTHRNSDTIDTPPAPVGTQRGKGFGLLGVALAILFATAAFFSGLEIGSSSAGENPLSQQAGLFSSFFGPDSTPDQETDLTEFWRVWNLLEEKYVSASSTSLISDEERLHGAISGLVKSYGDPYTTFLPPVETEQFEEDISGNFSGVGMEVGMRDGMITIIAPLPETPAEQAGLLSGDVLVRIDGQSTENMGLEQAVKRIRGEKGTEVVLTIYREGELELKDVTVVRDTIDIPTVKTEHRDGVFIVSLYNFNALSEFKMQEAMREYVRSGTDKMVIDLRGNPGGFLQSAVSIASYFLPAGKVVVREHFGNDIDDQLFRSQGRTLRAFSPDELVVLINGGSASASEILAGALREHEVATLIGQRTFGKGSVQELVDLPEGSSLKVTVARWLTPNGVSISEGGLEPDIAIKRTPQQYLDGEDPQLTAALEYLAGKRDFGTSSLSFVDAE